MKKASNASTWSWSEETLQIKVFVWFNNTYPDYRGLLFHVPNGGTRKGFEAKRFQLMGLVPGVADLLGFIGVPFALELKKPDGSNNQSAAQTKWEAKWKSQGHQYVTMNDFEEIKEFLTKKVENHEWEMNQLNM